MKKRYVLPIIGAIATVGVGYYMKNKGQNESFSKPFINAGIPDQIENNDPSQLENSKMVSEGSQYGIHYFNEMAEDEMEALSEKISE